MKDFRPSRNIRGILVGIGALVLALLIFHAGVVVGAHRGWGREFRAPFFLGGFALPHGFIPNAHGAVGQITAVTFPTFAMTTRDGTSQTVLIATSTPIKAADGTATTTLFAGERVIVLGEPDSQNRIDARFIHVLPNMPPAP